MKKAFLVFSLCLLLALAGLTAAAVSLHHSRDDVAVTLTTRSGDPVQAQGLTIAQQARYSTNLVWDLTIPAEDPTQAETDFTYHARDLAWTPHETEPLNIYVSSASTHYLDGKYTVPTADLFDNDPALTQLIPLLEEIAARTEPGGIAMETIRPGDYMDSQPIQVYASLPGTALRYDETATDYYDRERLIPQVFQNAFPLAFPEDEVWKVTLKKRKAGYLEEVGYESAGPTGQIYPITDYNDQALYFAFGQDTWPTPDYSRIPMGNGVYRMDMTHEKDESFLEVKTLTNIFPLPDEAMVLDLTLDQAENLLVTWYLDGDYTCTILDGETMEPTDTISLFHKERQEVEVYISGGYFDQEYSYTTWGYDHIQALPGEDHILFAGDTTFRLFLPTAEGWQEQFSADLPEELRYSQLLTLDAAWNGEKLALGYAADVWTTGLTLWVYDGTGDQLFHGVYETSLTNLPDTEDYSYNSTVVLVEEKEVRLGWE